MDVAVIGGALAGAAAALLLRREHPEARVAIFERTEAHGRKVGEATVEVSAYFLMRVLGLTDHLQHEHLLKQGLRFWFANERAATAVDCSEIGGRYLVRVPSFQLDRARLDEEVLRRAGQAGATVRRGTVVREVELAPGRLQRLRIASEAGEQQVRARWVIDASGVASVLARKCGWRRTNTAHPTSAAWARWRGVADWDAPERARDPGWSRGFAGLRGTATNHLMGRGWWAWMIPLRGGDTSIGVVFDERLVEFPHEGPLAGRIRKFLEGHPVAGEMLKHAEPVENDVHWRRHLAYRSEVLAGDGFVLVGDAAAFMDPFYSPGMDWVSFTVSRAVDLVGRALRGEAAATLAARYHADFTRSHDRWFEAVYRDKYEYLGDYELMRLGFVLDLGCYYLGVASQPYRRGDAALLEPPFVPGPSVPVFHLMRTYNRRLAAIARARRARGTYGRENAGRRCLVPGFTFSPTSGWPIVRALLGWAALELREGWRTWLPPSRATA